MGILARSVPGLTAAFGAIFVPVLIVTFAEQLQALIEKFTKAEDEIRKLVTELDDYAASSVQAAQAIELQNLKLEDQIAKLEGRPTTNRLKEAALESTIAVEKLDKALADSLGKAIELFEKADVGVFKAITSGLAPSSVLFGLGDEFKKAKEAAMSYQAALSQVREAETTFALDSSTKNKKTLDESRTALKDQEQNYLDELQRQGDRVDTAISKQSDRHKTTVIEGLQGLSQGKILGATTESTDSEANKKYEVQKALIEDLTAAVKGHEVAINADATAETLRAREAAAANAAETYARGAQLDEETIKANEAAGAKIIEVERQTAAAVLKETIAGIEYEVSAVEAGGGKKAAAELASIPKRIAAVEVANQAELDAFDKQIQNKTICSFVQ